MAHISNRQLFDTTSLDCSKLITKAYSTSFSIGIMTMSPKYRGPIYSIYGFVRYADEIVDTFHEYDKETLLDEFERDTFEAIDRGISLNPILNSFQKVVRAYDIDRSYIEAFIHSMRLDLSKKSYANDMYKEYIYGSAEVVGLMCLKVFCHENPSLFTSLIPSARSLGAAFQKVNFLRDIKADYQELGRTYFPMVDFNNFTKSDKIQIEKDIQQDFDDALVGIKQLPIGVRIGVYLAYIYYLQLFKQIKQTDPSMVQSKRIRVPDSLKILLLCRSYVSVKLDIL